jgi:2-phosphosulfolactate phosphatase
VPTPFDQRDAVCRCEWGVSGFEALAPADVIIVVDVLSFSTCVDVAVSRGAAVLPYPWKGASAIQFAHEHGAELAGVRGESMYSLSPASFLAATPGLRCVLPSPNGAELTLRAARTSSIVLAGCLRNAAAVAQAARQMGSTFNVCPAGERWSDGSLRPAIEDWLAAGAILRELPGKRSSEAAAAVGLFEQCRGVLGDLIAASASGRELIDRGYASDVELALDFDVSAHVPRFDGQAYVSDVGAGFSRH